MLQIFLASVLLLGQTTVKIVREPKLHTIGRRPVGVYLNLKATIRDI